MKNTLADQKDFIITTFNSYIIFKANLKKIYNKMDEEYIIEWQLQTLH
jgi:hypothetical protein